MSTLRYLNGILTLLALLLALNLWTAWSGTSHAPKLTETARAQGIPDAGAQRLKIINELKLLTHYTAQLKALVARNGKQLRMILKSGEIQVDMNLPLRLLHPAPRREAQPDQPQPQSRPQSESHPQSQSEQQSQTRQAPSKMRIQIHTRSS